MTGLRNWFITGVSGGIGRAIADAALARGERVFGTARRERDASAFADVAPGRSFAGTLDLDDHHAVAAAADEAVARLGKVDIVVNNAGRSLWASMEDTPIEEAKALFATNVFGPLAVMQAFLPHFRANGGGIFVNMSSGCGLFGVPGVGAYCGSKFALEGISETVAAEAAGFGVKVMLVEPGAVRTRFISDNTKEVGTPRRDYAAIAVGKSALDRYYQDHAMAPETVAARVLAALDAADPPLRLVVGDDTRLGAMAKFQAFIDQLAGQGGAGS